MVSSLCAHHVPLSLCQHLASRGAVWASESPLPDPLLWDWADPTWMPSADDPDHLAANAGWWCVLIMFLSIVIQLSARFKGGKVHILFYLHRRYE